METALRIAINTDTGQEYEIEIPATHVVKKTLLDFDYPAQGIQIKDAADALAEQFALTDEQINAKNRAGNRIFLLHVGIAANALVKSGKLLRPKYGWIINPMQPPPIDENETLSPIVIMENEYQKYREGLHTELLQKIKDNPPDFFEELVLDLLVEMGYGGSRADAEAVGRSGDGGIDGIIKEDKLGLGVIYVQAKRWENKVPEKEIRDFTGALTGKGARKGIFITTSNFTPPAKRFAEEMTSKKIILIDGKDLVHLMIDHNIGVSTERTYEIKQIDADYFGEEE